MRQIFRIMKTELAILFYSPVAWFLLVCFAVQVGVCLSGILDQIVAAKTMGRAITFSVTNGLVLGMNGLFETIQSTIYLYVPLLTMGLLSREIFSGSLKLLLSSPVSALQAVLGKYLAMVVMSAIMTFILGLTTLVMIFGVPSWDVGTVLCGLLGLFLLLCTYSAIGLFFSSLTGYQVVAAVATFSVLAFLSFASKLGQNSEVMRGIMYWMSISGRTSTFIGGLLTSEDVLYFLMVSGLFVCWTVLRISGMSTMRRWYSSLSLYVAALLVVVLVGGLSMTPGLKFYKDLSDGEQRTLAPSTREALAGIKGPIEITTYTNVQDRDYEAMSPSGRMEDKARFEMYRRFMPTLRMKYVYYSDPSELGSYLDRTKSDPGCVRVFKDLSTGREAFLYNYDDMFHYAKEEEIATVLKELVDEPVRAYVAVGNGSRSCFRSGDRDFSSLVSDCHFRYSLLNRGCDINEIVLDTTDIPSDAEILCLADPRTPLSAAALAKVETFLEGGGNMVIITDVGGQKAVAPVLDMLGLEASQGSLAQDNPGYATSVLRCRATQVAADSLRGAFKSMLAKESIVFSMDGAVALRQVCDKGFEVYPQLTASSWIETRDYDPEIERATMDRGESLEDRAVALYLTRQVGDKQQKIVVCGDADCISNKELQVERLRKGVTFANFSATSTLLRFLSDGRFPVGVERPKYRDRDITVTPMQLWVINDIYKVVIPLLIALLGIFTLLLRRKY